MAIEGQPVASAQGITISDCISLCFQNLNCKSINFDRTQSTCLIYSVGQSTNGAKPNPSMDFYEFNCGEQINSLSPAADRNIY
jgi:hypothetical protein